MNSARFIRLSALLTCAGLAVTFGAASAQQPDARSSLIVTPKWLAAHLHDQNLVLLHVGTADEYAKAHIAGARFISTADVATPRPDTTFKTRTLEMLPVDELRQRLEKFGITDKSRVIVYFGNNQVTPSTRVVLTLDYAGLGDATSLLDGGMPAWVAAGNATTADVPRATQGNLSALKVNPIVVTGEWVRDNATQPGSVLIDARNTVYYDGTTPGGPQGRQQKGHIPGAKSIPYDSMWTAKNELRPANELRDILTRAGIKPGDTIVSYCHIGQQATSIVFVARSLGIKAVLYDGSFEDWVLKNWPIELPPPR
jgi:thiosulfate/3-mercaptopyruvate sulfurtransferase